MDLKKEFIIVAKMKENIAVLYVAIKNNEIKCVILLKNIKENNL